MKQFKAIFLNFMFNFKLHKDIEDLNDKNEVLRENIKELLELINEYKEIQV